MPNPKQIIKQNTIEPVPELKRRITATREVSAKKIVVAPVSAGPIDKVVDYSFNPTRDKEREVTVIDRLQGKLLPLLDVINCTWSYVLEIAYYRQDKETYKAIYGKEDGEEPIAPNLIEEFIHRTAQWQRSVAGMSLKSAIDLALAEMETRNDTGEEAINADAWDK